MQRSIAALLSILVLAFACSARAGETFEFVSVRLEQEHSDKELLVVFEANGGEAGLASLRVVAPNGRIVFDFKVPKSKMRIRELNLESPELMELATLQAEFPAGEYTFTGTTVTGAKLNSKATLSHTLPEEALLALRPDEANVPDSEFLVTWGAGRDLVKHLVAIENEQTGVKLTQATLPGAATTFVVPHSFLTSGTKYKVSIGTELQGGEGDDRGKLLHDRADVSMNLRPVHGLLLALIVLAVRVYLAYAKPGALASLKAALRRTTHDDRGEVDFGMAELDHGGQPVPIPSYKNGGMMVLYAGEEFEFRVMGDGPTPALELRLGQSTQLLAGASGKIMIAGPAGRPLAAVLHALGSRVSPPGVAPPRISVRVQVYGPPRPTS